VGGQARGLAGWLAGKGAGRQGGWQAGGQARGLAWAGWQAGRYAGSPGMGARSSIPSPVSRMLWKRNQATGVGTVIPALLQCKAGRQQAGRGAGYLRWVCMCSRNMQEGRQPGTSWPCIF